MFNWSLLISLTQRDVIARYKSSILGIFWSLITPLLMLGVYTFIFGSVFQAKWSSPKTGETVESFAVTLFSGLIIFQLFADVISRCPNLIVDNKNLVTKIVFPVEILMPSIVLSALFHFLVNLIVLCVFQILLLGYIPLESLLLPIIVFPVCLLMLGLGWFLSSIGVFLRDINQFIGTLLTAMLFLSPIFYPLSALPEWLQPWLLLNPLSVPVEAARNILIFSTFPDFTALLIYWAISIAIAFFGYFVFMRARKGFSDVL